MTQPCGFLFIDKPEGMTSHDVVNHVRRLTGHKRVGHSGTLDPFASGLLIIGVGREATREMEKLVGLDKKYEAEFILGARSNTDDRTGHVEKDQGPTSNYQEQMSEEQIRKTLKFFVGEIAQIPPTYSAIKIGGKKMYASARAGTPLIAKPRRVIIFSISDVFLTPPLHDSMTPSLSLTIHCSSGTYIRALARDLGERLGIGGYVNNLRRTTIGPFTLPAAVTLNTLNKQGSQRYLRSIPDVLQRL